MNSFPVDYYKFTDPISTRVMKAWVSRETYDDIPWTPMAKPLSRCRVALVSTAAIALKQDQPFDQQGEIENPWWGDPTHRVLPANTRTADVRIYHTHIDTRPGEEDLNCILPLERLSALVSSGLVGELAPSHYAFMGYILREQELLEKTTPLIISRMREERVDAVLLVPV